MMNVHEDFELDYGLTLGTIYGAVLAPLISYTFGPLGFGVILGVGLAFSFLLGLFTGESKSCLAFGAGTIFGTVFLFHWYGIIATAAIAFIAWLAAEIIDGVIYLFARWFEHLPIIG